jgi:hypothetical protein
MDGSRRVSDGDRIPSVPASCGPANRACTWPANHHTAGPAASNRRSARQLSIRAAQELYNAEEQWLDWALGLVGLQSTTRSSVTEDCEGDIDNRAQARGVGYPARSQTLVPCLIAYALADAVGRPAKVSQAFI